MKDERSVPSPQEFAQAVAAQISMTTPDYSDLRSRHRREIRNDPWPRHESDPRILALGFCSVMVLAIAVVTAVAVMWP